MVWSPGPALSQERKLHTMVNIHGLIYLMGGRANGVGVSQSLVFNEAMNKWDPMPDLEIDDGYADIVLIPYNI